MFPGKFIILAVLDFGDDVNDRFTEPADVILGFEQFAEQGNPGKPGQLVPRLNRFFLDQAPQDQGVLFFEHHGRTELIDPLPRQNRVDPTHVVEGGQRCIDCNMNPVGPHDRRCDVDRGQRIKRIGFVLDRPVGGNHGINKVEFFVEQNLTRLTTDDCDMRV